LAGFVEERELVVARRIFWWSELPPECFSGNPQRIPIFSHNMPIKKLLARAQLSEALGKFGAHGADIKAPDISIFILGGLQHEMGSEVESCMG
jgi:hypothetical protein